MQGRKEFLTHVIDLADELLTTIEEREEIDPDMLISRETAETLQEELRALQ